MKTRFSLLVLVLVFFSISPIFAQDKIPCTKYSRLLNYSNSLAQIVKGKKPLVYAEPDPNSKVLGEFTPEIVFHMGGWGIKCYGNQPWWAVSYNSGTGYVSEMDGKTYNVEPYVMPSPSGVFPTSTTPLDPKVISLGNASQLVEQTRFGSGWITDTDWSPDGQTFVVATSLGLRLYDSTKLDDKAVPFELLSQTVQINDVAFNADGQLLAAAGEDGIVYVWNTRSRQLNYTLRLGLISKALVFSPDGKWLAVAGIGFDNPEHYFGKILLLDAQTGTEQSAFRGQFPSPSHLSFSDDSKRLIFHDVGFDTEFDLDNSNNLILRDDYWLESISSWALKPDGSQVAVMQTLCGDGPCFQYLSILEVSNQNQIIGKDVSDAGYINKILFTPKGDLLFSVNESGELTARSPQTLQPIAVITGHAEVMTFSADHSLMATGGINGGVRVFTTPTADADGQVHFKQINVLFGIVGAVKSMVFSPNQTQIAAVGEDNTIRIWDIASAKLLATYRDFSPPLVSLFMSTDEKLLGTRSEDHIYIWDSQMQKQLSSFKSSGYQTAFSPDNTQIVSGVSGHSDQVEIWNIESQTRTRIMLGNSYNIGDIYFLSNNRLLAASPEKPNRVRSITISPSGKITYLSDIDISGTSKFRRFGLSGDGNKLAIGNELVMTIYDIASHKPIQQFADFGYWTTLSHDGRLLADMKTVGPNDKQVTTITLWDTLTGTLITETDQLIHPKPIVPNIAQSQNSIRDMELNYDGRLLAVAYEDGSIRLWDMLSNREVAVLKGHTSGVSSLAFSTDGTKLYSASKDGTVRQWGLPS